MSDTPDTPPQPDNAPEPQKSGFLARVRALWAKVPMKWQHYAGALVVALLVWLLTGKKELPPLPIEESGQAGWIRDDAEVERVKSQLEFPVFSTTPAWKVVQESGDADVYLWKAAVKVLGDMLPGRNQLQVGSCVSFGTASAVEHTLLFSIANWDPARGPPPDYKDLAQEVIYGGSRVQILGGRIRGDGSTGAAGAQFTNKYGVVPRGIFGKWDLSKYTESQCRAFGQSGVPKDLLDEAAKSKVKTITLVQSADQAAKAIQQGYGIAVCSNQGFARQRDKDGFSRPQGSWAHCMAIIGVQFDRKGFFILNSWGDDYFTGPMGKGDGPKAGFWADWDVVDRMIRSGGDTWAFSDAEGFPSRKIDWFLKANPANPPALARNRNHEPAYPLGN